MATENNLAFLKARINEIKSAILYNMTSELVRIPVSIISILRVDESGWLWFFVKKPQQLMTEYEKSFPAHLQFYRKGKPFYIHVSGHAVVAGEEEMQKGFDMPGSEMETTALQNLSLIKFKMIKVEYYEQKNKITTPAHSKSPFQNLYGTFFKPARYQRPIKLSVEIA